MTGRSVARRLICSALVVLAALILPSLAAAAEPVGSIEEFTSPGWTESLAPGAAGSVWFTFKNVLPETYEFEEGLGQISAEGKVTKVTAGLDPGAKPATVTAGPEGNVWLVDAGSPPALGRIAPDGSISEFPLAATPSPPAFAAGSVWFAAGGGLQRMSAGGVPAPVAVPGTVSEVASAPDGSVWFAGKLNGNGMLGRVDLLGAVTEYQQGLPPAASISRLAVAANGSVWFLAGQGKHATFEGSFGHVGADGAISIATRPAVSPFYSGGLLADQQGNLWFTTSGEVVSRRWPQVSIGRIGSDGTLTPFDKCLQRVQPYTGPNDLTLGAEGNVWFAMDSETEYHGGIGGPSGIGRVTPGGTITEFKAGLQQPPTVITTASDGTIWFGSKEAAALGRLRPPSEPPNGFLVLGGRPARPGRPGRATIVVPGPGRVTLESSKGQGSPAVRRVSAAVTCRPLSLPVRPSAALRSRVAGGGRVKADYSLTYQPSGGTPYTVDENTYVEGPPRSHSASRPR